MTEVLKNRPLWKSAYGITLIDLLALIFLIDTPLVVGVCAAKSFGLVAGIGFGFLAAAGSTGLVIAFYKRIWKLDDRRCAEVRELYPGLYRVIQVPPDKKNTRLAEFAEIRI